MSTNLSSISYSSIPNPKTNQQLFKVKIKSLHPTQMCIGLAEVLQRKQEFTQLSDNERLSYFKNKPVPLVSNLNDELWMLDRHHRLRALIEINEELMAYGYIVSQINTEKVQDSLDYLANKGWLYLYDNRGVGPQSAQSLPISLLEMKDDPYRSLVWKLKRENLIVKNPSIPYHEYYWCTWLRRRPLPPFNSKNLAPALPVARKLICSFTASHLAGWSGAKC